MGKRGVEKYHDRVAGRYDAMFQGEAYWEFYDAVTWEHFKPHLPRDLSSPCLDLGCGTGKWGLKLARTGFPTTLVDISQGMLDQARDAALDLPDSKQPKFLKADIADLSELPAAHFAFAVAQGDPLSHTEEPLQALRGIRRSLRPGGLLVASVDNRAGGIWFYLERGDLEGLEAYARTGRTHWLTAEKAERFPVKMFLPDELKSMLAKAGLETVDIIGKTVLDLRRHGKLLADPANLRRLLVLEKQLHHDPSLMGLAGHLQVIARRPAEAEADRSPNAPRGGSVEQATAH